jgi:hypothetical protein
LHPLQLQLCRDLASAWEGPPLGAPDGQIKTAGGGEGPVVQNVILSIVYIDIHRYIVGTTTYSIKFYLFVFFAIVFLDVEAPD